ncbi:HAMP domain-containing sensor histidine kinase [Actinomadura rugatobispora]|uniref:histidine kinase n=1 Tax=Actinomadura rugatobispora TaxID=1994 RepID=A0ABW1A3D7_9ACTN|nr:HAMP domain-containing sensor histidine kinase [Actinomadura rugatobispora]
MESTPLRRRLLVAIAGIAAVTIMLFALPLGVAVQRLYRNEAVTELERDATVVAAATPDDVLSRPRSVRPPAGLRSGLDVGVYRTGGQRLAGSGPVGSALATHAADGRLHEAVEGVDLAVVAPVPSDQGVALAVRVSMPVDKVHDRVERAWLTMAGLAVAVLALAVGLARRQASRLATPLERLTQAAQALGEGDFSVRTRHSGIREADTAGVALEATGRRLGQMLDRERAFSADVSHQLRTPLTGLLLGLEGALQRPGADHSAALRTALERGRRLEEIIDDLLLLARDAGPERGPLDVAGLLADLEAQWHGRLAAEGRPLTVEAEEPLPEVAAAASAVQHILEVLVDNATRHGRGRITVLASDIGGALAIDVTDEGTGPLDAESVFERRSAGGEGHGIGLALARSLAEAEGGRLVLRGSAPTTFTLLLPGSASEAYT